MNQKAAGCAYETYVPRDITKIHFDGIPWGAIPLYTLLFSPKGKIIAFTMMSNPAKETL